MLVNMNETKRNVTKSYSDVCP